MAWKMSVARARSGCIKCFRTFVRILTSVKAMIEILGTLIYGRLVMAPQIVWQRGSITRLMESKEVHMDWNRVEGDWKQMKGRVKEKWGKLTDDDLTAIAGRRDQLEGKIQERYGYAKNSGSKGN